MDHYAEVFVDAPDDHSDLEPDYLVYRKSDHAAGTVQWRLEDACGKEIYARNTPSTPEWEAQVKHDITELIADRGEHESIRLLLADGEGW